MHGTTDQNPKALFQIAREARRKLPVFGTYEVRCPFGKEHGDNDLSTGSDRGSHIAPSHMLAVFGGIFSGARISASLVKQTPSFICKS